MEFFELANSIPAIAVGVIVIYLVIRLSEIANNFLDRRLQYDAQQATLWKDFFKEQRLATVGALADVSNQLRAVSEQLAGLTNMVMRHDEQMESVMRTIQELRDRERENVIPN